MRKIYLFTVGIMMMILASSGVSAQESISLTETEQPGSFPIVTDNSTAVIVFDKSDAQVVETAANLGGKKFIGTNLAELIGETCGCEAWIINDADAAGMAEVKYGAGKDCQGVALMLTVGTGIGTAMFSGGHLVPNLELGHLKMRNKATGKNTDAERLYSDAVRKKCNYNWRIWAERFNRYLQYVHALCWPDLIIIGGGAAAKSDKFMKYIDVNCDIIPAELQNRAGIIGAAYMASKMLRNKKL